MYRCIRMLHLLLILTCHHLVVSSMDRVTGYNVLIVLSIAGARGQPRLECEASGSRRAAHVRALLGCGEAALDLGDQGFNRLPARKLTGLLPLPCSQY